MTRRFFKIAPVLLIPVALVALLSFFMASASRNSSDKQVVSVANNPGFVPTGSWADLPNFPNTTLDFGNSGSGPSVPLQMKRSGAAAYPPNGKIYLFGGRHRNDGNDISLPYIWEYDPAVPATPVVKSTQLEPNQYGSRYLSDMAVATLTDTSGVRIYAIGGASVNSEIISTTRVYDPVANTLSVLATDPWPATPARVPGGWAVLNNKLYIFGGYSAKPASAVYADTWVFDPMGAAGSKWSQIPSANLSVGRAFIAGAALDGYIYAVGGDLITGSVHPTVTSAINVERLDPSQGSPVWTARASLPTASGDMGAWAYDSNTGYEISGKLVVAGGGYPDPVTTSYIYDPGSDTWSSFAPMLRPRRNYAATQLNGFLYAWGGYDVTAQGYTGSNTSMVYDASQGPSSTNTPVPPTATTVPPTSTSPPAPTNTAPPPPTDTAEPQATATQPLATEPPATATSEPTAEATATACAISFSDVPVGSTWYPYVTCLVCHGIITGYPDGTFRPNNDVTRGQLSKIVSNSAGFSDPATQMFEDVPVGSTFFDFIGRLASRGYIGGYACGGPGEPCVPPDNRPYFRPDNNATRGQISKIVSNAAGFNEPATGQTFEDVAPGSTFYDFVERLASRNVINGYPCGGPGEPCMPPTNRPYLRPFNNASRGQTTKMVALAFFPDCQTR
jgi:hypothetical protein